MKKMRNTYLTLLKCEKRLEKQYRKDVKNTCKKYKDSTLRERKLNDIELQYYASQRALDILINNQKEKITLNNVESIA